MTHVDSQSRLPTPGPSRTSFNPIPPVYQSPPPDCRDDHLNLQKKLKMHLVTLVGDVLSTHDTSFTGETCDKCLRTSTLSHNIGVQVFDPTTLPIKSKKFGQKLNLSTSLKLCLCCKDYITSDKRSFKNAWPSVLSSYWVNEDKDESLIEKIVSLLPSSIVELFCRTTEKFSTNFKNVLQRCRLIVADRTIDRKLILQTKKELTGADMKRNFDAIPLPDVICPWGCWEFIEKCQTMSFENFIAKIDPQFRKIAFEEYDLVGICPNYPEGFKLLEKFDIKPAIILNDDGSLSCLTCSKHSGESLQYLHPPRNPLLSSVSPNKPERLALTQQQINIVKTGKPKFNSHSSHLIEERGSYTGISSSTLQFPTFLENSTLLTDLSEHVISKGRSDVYPLVDYFLENNMVDQNFAEFLFNSNLNLTQDEILAAIVNTTNISLYDAFRMQNEMNSSQDKEVFQMPVPIYAHQLSGVSQHGFRPQRQFSNKNECLSVLEGLSRFSPSFLSTLRKSSNVELCRLSKSFANLVTTSSRFATTKTKSTISSIFENFSVHLNLDATSLRFMQEFVKVMNVPAVTLPSRSFNKISTPVSASDMIFVFAPSRAERDANIPPDTILCNSDVYQLAFLSKNFTKAEFYCRHSRSNSAWFDSFTSDKRFTETTFAKFYDFASKGTWDFAVYEKVQTSDRKQMLNVFLTSVGGQNIVRCSQHDSLLIQKNPLDPLTCYDRSCNNKAKWVCPKVDCTTGVCKNHSEQMINGSNNCAITSEKTRSVPQFAEHSDNPTDSVIDNETVMGRQNLSSHELEIIFEPDDYLTMSIDSNNPAIPVSSNAGVPSVTYQPTHNHQVPTKVLLNNFLNILQRTKAPLWTTNAHKNFLQSIVSRIPNTSVPLLYPESLLFPGIFWKQEEDGSFPGAIPSFLLQSDKLNRKLGFATVTNHLWSRLTNGALLTSSSLGYASLAFDIKMNQELNKSHSNYIVFKRGFEDYLQDDEALKMPSCAIKWDGLDSSKRVQEVAAACAEESPHYFFTLTCSMAGQFGIRPLFEAINEAYACENKDVYESVVQSFMGLFVRMWERVSSIVMSYVEKSIERPLGQVSRIWWRYEFQTSQGNLPHIHCLLWVNELKSSESFQNRVVLKKSQLLLSLEDTFLKTIGLVRDTDHAFNFYKDAVRIHYHSCAATNFRCHKKTDENGQSYCRYPTYPTSSQYHLEEVDVNHSEESFHVLSLCQLAKEKIGYNNTMCVTDDLKAGQWLYPSLKHQNVTPMNPHIFVLTESQNNLLICDKYLSARYIAKYAAGAEEKANVLISAAKHENTLQVDVGEIQNSKIASVQHRLQREQENRRKSSCQAKHICITECYWHLFDLPFVKSSFSSVCINTNEMECRPGLKLAKQSRTLYPTINSTQTSNLINIRDTLPFWRQFTGSQKTTIQLHLESSISVCNITAYSCRPPELLFIRNPKDYFWLIERHDIIKLNNQKLQQLFTRNSMVWIDGFGKQIFIRKKRVSHFLDYLRNSNSQSAVHLNTIFRTEMDLLPLTSTHDDSRSNAVVYFSKIYPADAGKFLVHLLLSMGQFDTELDLFNCNNLWDSFKNAGLWTNTTIKENILSITRKYILEEAQFLPGSTRMFDKNIVQCFQLLTDYFEKGSISYMQPPRVLLSSIKNSMNDKTQTFLQQNRMNIAKGLVASGKVENCPNEQLIAEATTSSPVCFSATITKLTSQSDSAFEKQSNVLKKFIDAIDCYRSGATSFIPHHFVLGKPGTGKSTITLVALCYSMCKGLSCMVTTLAGEKAAQFGGLHLHRLIPLPINTKLPVMKQVESTVQRLYCEPMRLILLKSLDVLIIEEIGMLNSEQWCVLDHVLRFINNCNLPMGGVLVIGNGDPKQLRPPAGPLLWISPVLFTNFTLFYLSEYVRMVDPLGTRVLALLDSVQITETETSEIVRILEENCRFVENWEDINDEAILKVVPTKQAERKLVQKHHQFIQGSHREYVIHKCVDEISRRGQNLWVATQDAKSVAHLNKNCLEPDSLLLYEGAPMRMTRNIIDLHVTQGQLCVVKKVPQSNSNTIEVYVAPPCVRTLPPLETDGNRNYSLFGWRTVTVKKMEGLPHNFRQNSSLRRIQFPLKPFQAATIHKCIGDDVPLLATQIATNDPSERSMFKLWEKNQLLVLVSRVKELKHLTFVGSKSSSLKTIKEICYNTSQWDYFIHNFVESLTNQNSSLAVTTFPISQLVYAMSRQTLPEDNCATVYCFMSLKDQTVNVGRCDNIRKELERANSYCAETPQSIVTKKPWALLCAAFEPGVSTTDASTIALESNWVNAVHSLQRKTPNDILQCLRDVTEHDTTFHRNINFVAFVDNQ